MILNRETISPFPIYRETDGSTPSGGFSASSGSTTYGPAALVGDKVSSSIDKFRGSDFREFSGVSEVGHSIDIQGTFVGSGGNSVDELINNKNTLISHFLGGQILENFKLTVAGHDLYNNVIPSGVKVAPASLTIEAGPWTNTLNYQASYSYSKKIEDAGGTRTVRTVPITTGLDVWIGSTIQYTNALEGEMLLLRRSISVNGTLRAPQDASTVDALSEYVRLCGLRNNLIMAPGSTFLLGNYIVKKFDVSSTPVLGGSGGNVDYSGATPSGYVASNNTYIETVSYSIELATAIPTDIFGVVPSGSTTGFAMKSTNLKGSDTNDLYTLLMGANATGAYSLPVESSVSITKTFDNDLKRHVKGGSLNSTYYYRPTIASNGNGTDPDNAFNITIPSGYTTIPSISSTEDAPKYVFQNYEVRHDYKNYTSSFSAQFNEYFNEDTYYDNLSALSISAGTGSGSYLVRDLTIQYNPSSLKMSAITDNITNGEIFYVQGKTGTSISINGTTNDTALITKLIGSNFINNTLSTRLTVAFPSGGSITGFPIQCTATEQQNSMYAYEKKRFGTANPSTCRQRNYSFAIQLQDYTN